MRAYAKKGFTLVELLVVIAILAVLAALLFPVFSRTRHKARQTTCASNQRQIGAALALYLQDFDETYPNTRFEPLGSQTAGDFEKNSWRSVLMSYLHNRQVMVCPANPDNHLPSYDPKFAISYAANMALSPKDYPTLPPPRDATGSGVFGKDLSPGVKAASIARPAECIAVVEITHVPHSAFVVDVANDTAPLITADGTVTRVYQDCLFTGHFGLTNYLFSDGHVKALKPTATYRGDAANYWYRDASPLGAEARSTLAGAQAHNE